MQELRQPILLGKRVLEVTKGTDGYPTYIFYPMVTVNAAELKQLPDAATYVLGEEIPDPTERICSPNL